MTFEILFGFGLGAGIGLLCLLSGSWSATNNNGKSEVVDKVFGMSAGKECGTEPANFAK